MHRRQCATAAPRARGITTLALVALVSGADAAHASPLSEAAEALAPGEWVELSTEDLAALAFGAHTGNAIPYSQSAAWDPVAETLHYIGQDHGGDHPFYFRYVAATNAWTNVGETPFQGHGYEHLAIDPEGRRLWHRPYGGGSDPSARRVASTPLDGPLSWTDGEPFPDFGYTGVALAIVFVPDLGIVVHNCSAGGVAIGDGSASWRTLGGYAEAPSYHCFAEHSPVHDAVVFGGGNARTDRLWRLDRDGTITELPTSPLSLGSSYATDATGREAHQANVAADPSSGDFIVYGAGQLWSLDPRAAGTWRRLPDPTVPHLDGGNMISAPITNHGVILYVACQGSDCHVFLYRHAPGSGIAVDFDAGPRGGDGGATVAGDAGASAPIDAGSAALDAGPAIVADGGSIGDAGAMRPSGATGACSCRVQGAPRHPALAASAWLALALAVAARLRARSRAAR